MSVWDKIIKAVQGAAAAVGMINCVHGIQAGDPVSCIIWGFYVMFFMWRIVED